MARAGRGGAMYAKDSTWWTHEAMHVNAMVRPYPYRATITERIRAMESTWISDYPSHAWDAHEPSLVNVSHAAFTQAQEADGIFMDRMKGIRADTFSLAGYYWRRVARRTGIPVTT